MSNIFNKFFKLLTIHTSNNLKTNINRIPSVIVQYRTKSYNVDYSNYPKLNESDIEETFVRGTGPGGQAVNKTSNCVVLRHKPTNIVIKCHIHRSLTENQRDARKILLNKLDVHLNGDKSVESQIKAIEKKKSADRNRKHKKLLEMKKKWMQREQIKNTD